ncbi:YihY family inner membrane protein [Marinobacterium sp. D7]|uniref:YihY family inner membrane protein n=1 Tax=Marinobacterium ramblicola TaxID=2849041 RepID=UPI001C2CEF15|nr:YihY family inner membrane protein [Marinobacterium ramblicola]MBV1787944.1 YihY family inner membrane protein [Marinobacterium ramblicola]
MIKRPLPVALLFLRDLVRQYKANQGVLNAAALTYTTLFAVVPLMTVSYAMLAAIPSFQGVGEVVQGWVFENFVPATGAVVQEHLAGFTAQARKLTAVGIVFLLITSIMMMKNIEAALNRIWRVSEPRKGMSSFLLYWAVLSLGPLLIGFGLLLTSYVASLPLFTDATAMVSRARLLALFPPLLSTLAFTLLYAAVPNCRVPLKNALIGGLAAALMFELAKRGFALFVTQFPSYELIYGAFAAVPLFLVWVFICWTIALLGAELSRALTIYHAGNRRRREPHFYTLLSVLERLWQAQQRGEPLEDSRLLQDVPALDQGRWDEYAQLLMVAGLVRRTEQGHYLLSRDLSTFTLAQLQALLPWPLPSGLSQPDSEWKRQVSERLDELSQRRLDTLRLSLSALFSGSVTQKQED